MRFETHRSNAGRFHSFPVGDDGAKLTVSATACGSALDARHAAADLRPHARSVDGTEVRR